MGDGETDMRRQKTITRFLTTKTIADATSRSLRVQEEESGVAQVNTSIDFNSKVVALLQSFGITQIDEITPAQRSLFVSGLILVKFAMHGLEAAGRILKNNNCSIERLGENKFGLLKAMKEASFLYKNEDVQVFLSLSGVRIDELSDADPMMISEIQLPYNIAAYSAQARKVSVDDALRKADWQALRASGVLKKYIQMFGSMSDVSNFINEKIMASNKEGNKLRARLSLMLKLSRLVTDKEITLQKKKFLLRRLKAMLKLALQKGLIADMAKIMRDMSAKLSVADRNIEEADRSVRKMLDVLSWSPTSMAIEMLV